MSDENEHIILQDCRTRGKVKHTISNLVICCLSFSLPSLPTPHLQGLDDQMRDIVLAIIEG